MNGPENVRLRLCPVCGDGTYTVNGRITAHSVYVDGWEMDCLASGMLQDGAERLGARLRKAAHP